MEKIIASSVIQELLELGLKKAGSITALSREAGVCLGVVRLWYKANAMPGKKNLSKLEDYVNKEFYEKQDKETVIVIRRRPS